MFIGLWMTVHFTIIPYNWYYLLLILSRTFRFLQRVPEIYILTNDLIGVTPVHFCVLLSVPTSNFCHGKCVSFSEQKNSQYKENLSNLRFFYTEANSSNKSCVG